jgi:hypothetical protein
MKQFKCVRWTVCVVINRLLTDIYFYIVFGVLEMQMNCYFNIFKFCDKLIYITIFLSTSYNKIFS